MMRAVPPLTSSTAKPVLGQAVRAQPEQPAGAREASASVRLLVAKLRSPKSRATTTASGGVAERGEWRERPTEGIAKAVLECREIVGRGAANQPPCNASSASTRGSACQRRPRKCGRGIHVEEGEQRGDGAQAVAAVGQQDRVERRPADGIHALERLQPCAASGSWLCSRRARSASRPAARSSWRRDSPHDRRRIREVGRVEQGLAEHATALGHARALASSTVAP